MISRSWNDGTLDIERSWPRTRTPDPKLALVRVTTEQELFALEPAWDDLWRRSASALPFNAPGWLLSWWTHLGGGDLRVYAAFDGAGALVGLLPLFLYRDGDRRRLLPLGISISDYFDGLIAPGFEDVVLDLLADALHADRRDWDVFELHELPAYSFFTRLAGPGMRTEVKDQSQCPWLDVAGFMNSPSRAGPQRRFNRARRRATSLNLEIERSEADAEATLDILFRLHTAQWLARGEDGVLASASVQAFHRAAAPRLAHAGALRILRARLQGNVIGVYYGFSDRRRAYGYLTGLDPSRERDALGTLLVGTAITQAFEAGVGAFDFLRGQEAYKYAWGATDRSTVCLRMTPCLDLA